MASIHIPYFGPIDPFNFEEEYTSSLELRGKEVMLDINFEDESGWVEPYRLEAVKKVMGQLVSMDAANRRRLYSEYTGSDSNMVRYYLQFHLEKIWRTALEKLIDLNNQGVSPIDQLFGCLHLVRVGFFPENEDVFAVFDYSIHYDYTEHMIVITYNLQGQLQEMTMEL